MNIEAEISEILRIMYKIYPRLRFVKNLFLCVDGNKIQ